MTETELLAAAAGAQRIGAALGIHLSNCFHNIGGRVTLLQQLHHHIKRWADMHEKFFKASTKIIMSLLAVF